MAEHEYERHARATVNRLKARGRIIDARFRLC